MQSALSRAAQARCLCNCSTCASVTGTVTRRATTASTRRRLIRPDVFTVFSSTLALSATMLDSARKDARNRQWDEAMERTRAEITNTEEDQNRRLSSLRSTDPAVEDAPTDADVFKRHDFRSKIKMLMNWERWQEHSRQAAGLDNWRGFPLDFLETLSNSDLEHILGREGVLRRFYGGPNCSELAPEAPGRPLSSKKIRTQEWSMMKLALQFLKPLHARAGRNGTPPDALQVVAHLVPLDGEGIERAIQETDERIAEIKSAGPHDPFPSPQSPQYHFSPSEQESGLVDFNVNLQRMLWETKSMLSRRLPEICNYLLSSHIAPNIHTYNLLLIRFCQLREDTCAQAVLKSIEETNTRSNEITHATTLRYLTAMNDRPRFREYTWKMHGWRRGLALANPAKEIDALARSRYHVFGKKSGKIAEKARMNEEVYTSLIVGVLKMFSVREALWYYSEMVKEGWKPTMEILTAMLRKSCELRDLRAGHELWKRMKTLCQAGNEITNTAYAAMLDLCKTCGQTDWYQQVASEAIACGILPQSFPKEFKSSSKSFKSQSTQVPTGSVDKMPTLKKLRRRNPSIPGTILQTLLAQSSSLAHLERALAMTKQEYEDLQRLSEATITLTSALSRLSVDISSTVQEVSRAIELNNSHILRYSLFAARQEPEQMSEVDRAFLKYKSSLDKKSGPNQSLPSYQLIPAAASPLTTLPV